MQRGIFFLLINLFIGVSGSLAHAAEDSVGVFHKSDKVVVLVNEEGSAGRLQRFMDFLGVTDQLQIISSDQSIKFQCRRNDRAASCTFRLLPSDNVFIGPGNVVAEAALVEIPAGEFYMDFESSMQDYFQLRLKDGRVLLQANKKVRQ